AEVVVRCHAELVELRVAARIEDVAVAVAIDPLARIALACQRVGVRGEPERLLTEEFSDRRLEGGLARAEQVVGRASAHSPIVPAWKACDRRDAGARG